MGLLTQVISLLFMPNAGPYSYGSSSSQPAKAPKKDLSKDPSKVYEKDDLICIDLSGLNDAQLTCVRSLYEDTPAESAIKGYADKKWKRSCNMNKLEKKGYNKELLEKLKSETLEDMLEDLSGR